MKIFAPAKINLGLRILAKRSDGYHEIQTVLVELVGLADELVFGMRKDGKINIKCEMLNVKCPPMQNLVYLAAKRLQKLAPKKSGVLIQLTKKIPIGTGLGGGSSDAAATLKALNKLWGLKLNLDKLEKIGAELGSDVPFFIRGGVQRGTGRGEILEKFSLQESFPREVVLVAPKVRVSTAWAYGQLDVIARSKSHQKRGERRGDLTERASRPSNEIASSRSGGNRNDNFVNNFEPIVSEKYPELQKIKQALLRAGAESASLSGSGSAVFGLFAKRPYDIDSLKKWGEVFCVKIR